MHDSSRRLSAGCFFEVRNANRITVLDSNDPRHSGLVGCDFLASDTSLERFCIGACVVRVTGLESVRPSTSVVVFDAKNNSRTNRDFIR